MNVPEMSHFVDGRNKKDPLPKGLFFLQLNALTYLYILLVF